MTVEAGQPTSQRRSADQRVGGDSVSRGCGQRGLSTAIWLCLLATLALVMPGCSGCRRDLWAERQKKLEREKEEKKKEKEKPKPDYEIEPLTTVPNDASFAFPFVKPGHWVTAQHRVIANNFDIGAELRTATTNSSGDPFEVEDTAFRFSCSRPAPLPKGQRKLFETTYFIPRVAADSTIGVWMSRELRSARAGGVLAQDPYRVASMPSFQYFFVVLAGDPDRYAYLKRMSAIAPPAVQEQLEDSLRYYRVVLTPIDRLVPLPSRSLTWTSIACILLDDVESSAFTPEQQEALLDWIHWGGQLIVSGPGSLDRLRGGFLEPYLPASSTRTREVDANALNELNANWSLTDRKKSRKRSLQTPPGRPLVGVELEQHPSAEFLPGCGRLVVERRIGAGRIVATAFSLTDRPVLTWASYDSFFNACLLRRPRRVFEQRDIGPDTRWADYPSILVSDPRLTTALRYFSRDIGHIAYGKDLASEEKSSSGPAADRMDLRAYEMEPDEQTAKPMNPAPAPVPRPVRGGRVPGKVPGDEEAEEKVALEEAYYPAGDPLHFGGYPFRPKYGMAAWNDRSGAANAVRQALKDAAGISVPRGRFVLQVLMVYLVVLVPLNWLVFRSMGKVEWCWVAAPLIAVVAAIAVVRLAQLDIGFARSLTEIGIAEVQGGYSRAHLTRYTALYTSLTTSYDAVFDETDSVAQPFGAGTKDPRRVRSEVHNVSLRYDRQFNLRGFVVDSNSTGILHSEQMCNLGGALALSGNESEGWAVENRTKVSLRDVGVLRRTLQGAVETAWVGNLDAGDKAPLRFRIAAEAVPHLLEWDQSSTTASYRGQATEILSRLDANHNGRLSRDEVRSDAEVAEQFPRLDRDGDGTWNQQELISWCGRSRAGEISLGQLVELASQGLQLDRGDVRLIGWTDQPMPGIAIRPRSAQETRRTMFVVHLRRGPLPAPRPDINCEADVREIETERPTEQGLPKAVPEPSPIGSPPSSAAATPGP